MVASGRASVYIQGKKATSIIKVILSSRDFIRLVEQYDAHIC